MDRLMDGSRDRWMDELMEGEKDEWMDGWKYGWMDERTGWIGGWMAGWIASYLWGAAVYGYVRCLAAGGLRVRSHLKPPLRDPGQVLHSQLLMRFGAKLRFSVRTVELLKGRYNKCSYIESVVS